MLHLDDVYVTDDGLKFLTNIKTLICKNCSSVNAEGLLQLIKNSRKLEKLDLYNLSEMEAEELFLERVNEIFHRHQSNRHLKLTIHQCERELNHQVPDYIAPGLSICLIYDDDEAEYYGEEEEDGDNEEDDEKDSDDY